MHISTEICQGGGVRGFVNYYSCKTLTALTLRITVLPFSSIREDHTDHCTLQCTIQGGGMEGRVDMWGGVRYRSEGVGGGVGEV